MTMVRSAAWPDLARLAKLLRPGMRSRARLAWWLARHRKGVLVAEENGDLAGCIVVQILRRGQGLGERLLRRLAPNQMIPPPGLDWLIQPLRYGRIQELVTAPSAQAGTVAESLMQGACHWLQARSVDAVHTVALPPSGPLGERYAGLGFRPFQFTVQRTLGEADRKGPLPAGFVRVAGHEDVAQLAPLVREEMILQQQLARFYRLRPDVDWAEFIVSRLVHPNCTVLVAEMEGRLAGYVLVDAGQTHGLAAARGPVRPARNSGRPGLIEDIYVVPDLRGRGLATALSQKSFVWLWERRVSGVRAAIWASNTASRGLSDRLGFQTAGVILRRAVANDLKPL